MSTLPELTAPRAILKLVLVGQVVAFVLALGRHTSVDPTAIRDMAQLSGLAGALTFGVLMVLRLAAPLLARASATVGMLLALLLLLIAAAAATEAVLFVGYQMGWVSERWPAWRGSLLLRSLMITAIVGLLALRYLALEQQAIERGRTQQEAQMQALQSRIRPHFLFNSLNSVAALARSDPDRAEAVLHDLADLFRVLLADARKLVPITAEREIARQYIELEQLRLGDRLKVKWIDNEVPATVQIPALTLQPLLENAIYHGIEPRFGGGTIKIEMSTEAGMLHILISNPVPEARTKTHQRGNKLAMDNIRQRLATQFGAAATLQTFEQGGNYYVKLKLPVARA